MFQVIYVSGPNSRNIFEQNAKTLHFALPSLSLVPTNETAKAAPESTPAPTTTPEIIPSAFFRAEVLPPQSGLFVGSFPVPLFAYSVQANQGTHQKNASDANDTAAHSDNEESDAVSSESATTLPPSPTESSSPVESDTSSGASETTSAASDTNADFDSVSKDASDDSDSTKIEEEADTSTDEPESSTESGV